MTGLDLKLRRIRAGAKQYDVAAALGVSPQFVSLVELGRKQPPHRFVERYLETVDRLRARQPEMPTSR